MIFKPKPLTLISLILTMLGIVACSPQDISTQKAIGEPSKPISAERTIVLADISNNPQKKIRKFQPLADYLAANLSQFDQGKVKIAPDMATMIKWLKSGEVDIYIDSPYPAMLAINHADAKPILRRWKKGSAEYHSIIFTISDRNITSLEDLKGKKVAFDHPFSTTGYMLPLVELIEAQLNPQETKSPNSRISEDRVGYIFSYEDENSIEWLLSGKVSAAAIDNIAFEKMSPDLKEKTLILAKTEKIARNLVLVRGDMSPDKINAISSTLIELDQTAKGRIVLEKFSRTTKFDNFPTEENLSKVQNLYQKTQN